MKETSKSVPRRLHDSRFATRYFRGEGIDIGAGADPISLYSELFPLMGKVTLWDREQGDAQFMEGLADASFDFVHSSHCLEHLVNPVIGLANWFRLVKPGGHLVVLVPDEDLYEQGTWPSANNPDHKFTFTMFKPASWSPTSINLLPLLQGLGASADIIKVELLDSTFRYRLPFFPQTMTPIGECAIEFIVRKRHPEEIAKSGRLPEPGRLDRKAFHFLTGR